MRGSRILVVEDEPLVAADLSTMLESFGCEVVGTAASEPEAIRLAEQARPELALMDIRLRGERDGIAAAEVLRARFAVPVVYVTAYADAGTLERASKTEPLGWVAKPFTERSVQTALAVALFRARADRQRAEQARWANDALDRLGGGVLAVDLEMRLRFMNRAAEHALGVEWRRAQSMPLDALLPREEGSWTEVLREVAHVGALAAPLHVAGLHVGASALVQDGTSVGLVLNLHQAGFEDARLGKGPPIPMCSGCKRVRGTQGEWVSLEVFLLDQYELLVSHGLCETCVRELYPDLEV